MHLFFIPIALFIAAYFMNMFYITVFYHRGLAHGAVKLSPKARQWVITTGNWITGIDPKAWVCMHRMHHLYSDRPEDPHSPKNLGVFGVMIGQLRSYENTLIGIAKKNPEYLKHVADLEFPIHWFNRNKIWYAPYLFHLAIAISLSFLTHSPLSGIAYWLGMMSHPVQGWLVNAFAHRYGYQNHENNDDSKNNILVALLTMGEGYQNNHHAHPASAKFSERWFELDGGHLFCLLAAKTKIISIPQIKSETPNAT